MRGGAFIMSGDWGAWSCDCASTGQNFIKSSVCSCHEEMGLPPVALGLSKKTRMMLREYRNMTSQAQMLVCAPAIGWWGCCWDVVAEMSNQTYASGVASGVVWSCQVTNNADSLENMKGRMVVRLHQIACYAQTMHISLALMLIKVNTKTNIFLAWLARGCLRLRRVYSQYVESRPSTSGQS